VWQQELTGLQARTQEKRQRHIPPISKIALCAADVSGSNRRRAEHEGPNTKDTVDVHVVGYNNSDNHTFPVSGEAVDLGPLCNNVSSMFPEYAE
jgi:hypothetical protein